MKNVVILRVARRNPQVRPAVAALESVEIGFSGRTSERPPAGNIPGAGTAVYVRRAAVWRPDCLAAHALE